MIVTDRLLLRPLEEGDASGLRCVWGDPKVMVFCGGASSDDRLLQAVKRCVKGHEEHGYSPLAVMSREAGTLIGVCGFKSLPDPEGVELLYHYVPTVWGRGYATEAVLGLLAWAELNLALRYVEASFDARNASSRKVLVKTGFAYLEDRWYEDVQRLEPVYRLELRIRRAP